MAKTHCAPLQLSIHARTYVGATCTTRRWWCCLFRSRWKLKTNTTTWRSAQEWEQVLASSMHHEHLCVNCKECLCRVFRFVCRVCCSCRCGTPHACCWCWRFWHRHNKPCLIPVFVIFVTSQCVESFKFSILKIFATDNTCAQSELFTRVRVFFHFCTGAATTS